MQISLDKGNSWQSLSLIGDRWSYEWDTRHVPDGTYTILARTNDVAGNIENGAHTTVVVANEPPKVKVQDWWWSWQAGQIKVKAAIVPIKETTITISCAPYHKDVVLHFNNDHGVPDELQWDRHCGEGAYAADSGDYPVTVQACDIRDAKPDRMRAVAAHCRRGIAGFPIPFIHTIFHQGNTAGRIGWVG